ncbi:MAG: ATP-dependent DNA helicase, partial [Firmicutes bacterium]|nr:ATP-dependent DNA helicase [Bacillota bacterium]
IDTTLPDGRQKPIVIATSSIALQRAIIRDYIPTISNILMEHDIIKAPLTAALRKGKAHYVCDTRLAHHIRFTNGRVKRDLTALASGAVVDLAAVELTPYVKAKICVDDNCSQNCPLYGKCRYTRFTREVSRGGYDFQVCNHNLFLADLIHRARGRRPLLPNYQAVVIDEAHKFLDAARDMYGVELSWDAIHNIINSIKALNFAQHVPTADVRQLTDRIESKNRLLFQFLNKEIPNAVDGDAERYPTKIRARTEQLLRALGDDVAALAALLERKPPAAGNCETPRDDALWALKRAAEAIDAFCRHRELVYWLEKPDTLKGIPKNLGELLRLDLWSQNIPIILTSGTLSAAGEFGHVIKKLGLDGVSKKRLIESSKPSPFNYRDNSLLYISEKTPFPDNDDKAYISSITNEVERLIHAAHGHTAVLFTSHDVLGRVFTELDRRGLSYPLFRMGRGDSDAVRKFKRSNNGVLFASGSMWEGVDIPGDILSMLIIVRLPFAVPDPVSEWERTLYAGMDEYKAKVIVPDMLVKLKQGFGRLIRTETDTGVVAILDSRANSNGAYRRRVLAALPPCGVTDRVERVERFLREKKSAAYFAA